MKIVVNIKGELHENDILIYDGKQFKPINKDAFFKQMQSEFNGLKDDFKELQKQFELFKVGVNGKLENYHNILQTLTKEE